MAKIKRVFLFDFDGVIIDSHSIREAGFRHLFQEYPDESVNRLIEYHRENGGISRYHKIRWFLKMMGDKSCSEEKVHSLASEFSGFVRPLLVDKELLIAPTVDFIQKYSQLVHIHIISGADQDEVCYLCKTLEIDHLFRTIRGSPKNKESLIYDEISRWGYDSSEIVMFGDAINDFNAANKHNIDFWGYNNDMLRENGAGFVTNWNEFDVNKGLRK